MGPRWTHALGAGQSLPWQVVQAEGYSKSPSSLALTVVLARCVGQG